MSDTLKNKVVFVSGANRGTGSVIAEKFLQEGAQVIVHRISENAELPDFNHASNVVNVWGDITQDTGATLVLEQIKKHFNEIHVLVNNFGQASPGKWESLNSEDWINSFQVNFLSSVRMCQMYTQQFKSNKYGRIVNLSTIGTYRPDARMPHYYAAKSALSNMTASLAKELSGTGITVNCVAPGLIKTKEVEAYYRDKAQKKNWGSDWSDIETRIAETDFPNPLKRIAERDEVANLVVFLASPGASFINAQTIKIDGGALDII